MKSKTDLGGFRTQSAEGSNRYDFTTSPYVYVYNKDLSCIICFARCAFCLAWHYTDVSWRFTISLSDKDLVQSGDCRLFIRRLQVVYYSKYYHY
uniref:Uncharacterized protein n=1 Tax=Octopus bimaculoides TaxID=37653 RepID=A0A0L8I0N3_OCTBM